MTMIRHRRDAEKNSKNTDPVARRLALTREILGLTEKEFAERAGMILSRYHLWETGRCPISLNSAMAICDAHGFTLDWLYRGKTQGLPWQLVVKVAARTNMSFGPPSQ
jgi:transcriptional regulator with XRE-family HTH domain